VYIRIMKFQGHVEEDYDVPLCLFEAWIGAAI